MVVIKKKKIENTKCIGKDVKNWNCFFGGRDVKWPNYCRKHYGGSYK